MNPETLYAVQFSRDGAEFYTVIKFDSRDLAESVRAAFAGYGSQFNAPYWRVREVDQSSLDFHAVISE